MTDNSTPAADQLRSEIDRLRAAIRNLDGMPDAQQPLQAQLADKERQFAQLQIGGVNLGQGSTIGQTGDIIAGNKFGGDQVLRDKIINQFSSGSPGESGEALLAAYLAEVSAESRRLPLADVDDLDPEQRAIPLDAVYIRLEVASVVLTGEPNEQRTAYIETERPRQMTAIEALSQNNHLVLLGTPGSGKSTFTNYLALCLASACLGQQDALLALGDGWSHGTLQPIRVVLREYAAWVGEQKRQRSAGRLLWDYLTQRAGKALSTLLQGQAQQGQAILLLDGLDEVPADLLRRVQESIAALRASVQHILVTCRMLDYAEPARQLASWPEEQLIPFSDDLQQVFIERWYAVLKQLRRQTNGDPDTLCGLLQGQVRARPELRRLAGNPLLLTMMAQLHAYEGRLPEKRVLLYAECLRLLLYRWRARPGEPTLGTRLELPQWDESDTNQLLDRLGYATHLHGTMRASAVDIDNAGDAGGADLPRQLLLDTAAQFFAAYDPSRDYERAQIFCNYISHHSNGLLQQHAPQIYRFPHRTFQEFLAARRLISDGDWDEPDFALRAKALAHSPQWHEVLLLAVSQLGLKEQTRDAAGLIEEVRDQELTGTTDWARSVTLAGELLAEVGRDRLVRLGTRTARLWDDISGALVRVLQPEANSILLLDTTGRVRAGTALGLLGDPRPGVGTLEPAWCIVPKGTFLLGSTDQDEEANDDERPQRTVDISGYRISRYPITNAQWRAFMDAGSYRECRWWSDAGWLAKERENWLQPDRWDDPRFNGANQPVVGISWYEATAFCRWLSSELGYEIRLPSEAEWEKAARGTDGRIYPWGNTWDETKANTVEGGISATTPVGCFPDGASPCGALDMSGNVFEWTATPWTRNYQESDGTMYEAEDGERFVWRGGAWLDDRRNARCASRLLNSPAYRHFDLGVRIVAALTHDG